MPAPHLPPPEPLSDLLTRGPVALFLDFDGTLVEIAPAPDAIAVPQDLTARLHRLDARLGGRLALVSGRGLDNMADHLGPLALARAGSHGADRLLADGARLGDAPGALCPAIIDRLARLAQTHDVLLERKVHGAALHFRSQPDLGPVIERAVGEIAAADGLVAKAGKCVIELVRPGADKGGAVDAFMAIAPFAGAVPVFIGDDVTDEDGFAAASRHGGFGIAVGERKARHATFSLSCVKDVHQWLKL